MYNTGALEPITILVIDDNEEPNRELVARLRAFIRLKTAEKALVKAETKYQRLFETMIMGYAHHRMIVNAQGKAVDYKFLEINPEFEKITGLKREKLLGKTVFEVFPQTEMYWIDRYSKVAFTGKEERFVNFSSDMNRYFEVYAFSPAEGEFSTLFYDVTDRELAKGKLEKYNQNLQQLNNDRNKFFQIIAHDLKSPFNSLLGFSQLLVEHINNKDYDGIDKYAKAIEKTSRQSYELVINLLEWARTQTGRIDFSPELFELSDLVNKILLLFDPIAKDKSIGIKNTMAQKTILFADKPMINVVLRNLISNAIRFTPSGGEITIADESTKDAVTVKVSDSGVGMTNDRLEKLFLSDNIDSAPDTNNQKGTGLGLILCREFVDRHGGRIWAESEVGKGSAFYFTLPYNTEKA